MNKKLIRLTEQDLHKIVKESVNKILNESHSKYTFIHDDSIVDPPNIPKSLSRKVKLLLQNIPNLLLSDEKLVEICSEEGGSFNCVGFEFAVPEITNEIQNALTKIRSWGFTINDGDFCSNEFGSLYDSGYETYILGFTPKGGDYRTKTDEYFAL